MEIIVETAKYIAPRVMAVTLVGDGVTCADGQPGMTDSHPVGDDIDKVKEEDPDLEDTWEVTPPNLWDSEW